MEYLTNIPAIVKDHGICKVLAVRRETIHIKHVLTEVFVRKTIGIDKYLKKVDMTLPDYIAYLTNRIRRVHYFDRNYENDLDKIVKLSRNKFFPSIDLMKGLKAIIVLDFDGVVTDNTFTPLYRLCQEHGRVEICSANPTVTAEWFWTKGMCIPAKIHAMKGKKKKIKRLIQLQQKNDYIFYVDNEIEYLEYAWLFGIQTYHWDGRRIKHFSMNSK